MRYKNKKIAYTVGFQDGIKAEKGVSDLKEIALKNKLRCAESLNDQTQQLNDLVKSTAQLNDALSHAIMFIVKGNK